AVEIADGVRTAIGELSRMIGDRPEQQVAALWSLHGPSAAGRGLFALLGGAGRPPLHDPALRWPVSPALLHDVRKLVREQAPPARGARRIGTAVEHDVLPDCVGPRLECLRSRTVDVDAHPTEVEAEARLELRARFVVQRLSAGLDHAI